MNDWNVRNEPGAADAMAKVFILIICVVVLMLVVGWIQWNFGTVTAALTLGGILFVLTLVGGVLIGGRIQRQTMEAASFIVESLAGAQAQGNRALAEQYRVEREQTKLAARGLMIEAQAAKQLPGPTEAFPWDVEADAESFQWVEE